jgi:SNF2 family DNA or RNA helicase
MIAASVFDLNAESDPMQVIKNDSISPDDFEMILNTLHPDGKYLSWISSAKINKMIEILLETREQEKHVKTVIFSQFTTLLAQAARALEIHEFRAVTYTGAMQNDAREDVLNTFRENSKIDVILVSLKAGGVGLNLTCASQVIMLDLWCKDKINQRESCCRRPSN